MARHHPRRGRAAVAHEVRLLVGPALGNWAKVLQLALLIIVVGLVATLLVVTLRVTVGDAHMLSGHIVEQIQVDAAR